MTKTKYLTVVLLNDAGLDVREIINPSKTAEEMETDVRSHKDYFVGKE